MAVHRLPRPPRAEGEAISATPRITRDGTGGAVVRLRHHAPAARAVALLANGWWRPEPRDACDLEPIGDGWWEASFAVPDTWRATYGFLEHHGEGDPPWWEHGLKGSAARTATAAGAAAGHGASRVAGMRSVLAVPADGPFATPAPGTPDPPSAPLRLPGAGDVPIRAWASLPGDPGGGAPDVGGPDPAAPLPLLVLTDAAFHLGPDDGPGGLGTLARLRAGVTAGLLPPLACVLLGSAGRRDEELGVPGGHAPLIAERLLPTWTPTGSPGPTAPSRGSTPTPPGPSSPDPATAGSRRCSPWPGRRSGSAPPSPSPPPCGASRPGPSWGRSPRRRPAGRHGCDCRPGASRETPGEASRPSPPS